MICKQEYPYISALYTKAEALLVNIVINYFLQKKRQYKRSSNIHRMCFLINISWQSIILADRYPCKQLPVGQLSTTHATSRAKIPLKNCPHEIILQPRLSAGRFSISSSCRPTPAVDGHLSESLLENFPTPTRKLTNGKMFSWSPVDRMITNAQFPGWLKSLPD